MGPWRLLRRLRRVAIQGPAGACLRGRIHAVLWCRYRIVAVDHRTTRGHLLQPRVRTGMPHGGLRARPSRLPDGTEADFYRAHRLDTRVLSPNVPRSSPATDAMDHRNRLA